jgi:hypothetical protein
VRIYGYFFLMLYSSYIGYALRWAR